jgi:hypothetical protein
MARRDVFMSAPGPDPLAEFNRVLSDVIDAIREVKQAEWKVPKAHELHADLDRLFSDLLTWKTLLDESDAALGVSPLAFMPTVEGRMAINLWRETRPTRRCARWLTSTSAGSRITCQERGRDSGTRDLGERLPISSVELRPIDGPSGKSRPLTGRASTTP